MNSRKDKSAEISTKDLTISSGTDAMLNPGRPRKTLAVRKNARDTFFAKRMTTKEFLLRYDSNPPIEEGKYSSLHQRDREGELIVTISAIRYLINELIIKPYASRYLNTKNLHVIDECSKFITSTISEWANNREEDCKIIYLNDRHMISIYLRLIDSKVHCLVLDSEPERPIKKVVDAIYAAIPDAIITRSTTPLQKDFYSCPIFTIRAMKFFVKHGKEVFSHIDQQQSAWNEELKCFELHPHALMPELMKMCQSRINLPEEILRQIVSHKKGLTLEQYLMKYDVELFGKSYNSSALIKRYQYLQILDQILKLNVSHQDSDYEQPTMTKEHCRIIKK